MEKNFQQRCISIYKMGSNGITENQDTDGFHLMKPLCNTGTSTLKVHILIFYFLNFNHYNDLSISTHILAVYMQQSSSNCKLSLLLTASATLTLTFYITSTKNLLKLTKQDFPSINPCWHSFIGPCFLKYLVILAWIIISLGFSTMAGV